MSQTLPQVPATRVRTRRDDTADLTARLGLVRRAMDIVADQLGEEAVGDVRADIARVAERLELGVDHTVVALLGGTGSGKSSLFNAISGLLFADVGVRRPTTSQATACVWGSTATPLLDWLGIAPDRRIRRESELDADVQAPLRGLILLDMPDHDSVVAVHRARVDRIMPLVDLLVWVVDPQKYADQVLHSGYLEHLHGHEAAMLVVLNQMDRVPTTAHQALVEDLSRLLHEDGLTDLRIMPTSARTGWGVDAVRRLLTEIVSRRSTAAERAGAEMADITQTLRRAVPGADDLPPDRVSRALNAMAGEVAAAAGLEDVLGAISVDAKVKPPSGVTTATVGELTRTWLRIAEADVDERWLGAVKAALPDTAAVAARLDDAVRGTTLPAPRTAWQKLVGRRGARRLAADYRARLSAALVEALRGCYVRPTGQVLARRAEARRLLAEALPVEVLPDTALAA